ncbi:hypothetical protein CISG_00808 [Coccidioides immitis RMSCC 3703]|uniref:Uncharacterized protein n=2 Tax=Coccidioides immitis TaxID=5501 RepID=A0A0J8QUD3_COCIT|nr:hypothetical protein CIRG_03592 [Coccidioides immitis RMSCC 2394]KMU74878.1 hypothetical protein CISG_00808 [Coccidioides immitis RMSCC 3703]
MDWRRRWAKTRRREEEENGRWRDAALAQTLLAVAQSRTSQSSSKQFLPVLFVLEDDSRCLQRVKRQTELFTYSILLFLSIQATDRKAIRTAKHGRLTIALPIDHHLWWAKSSRVHFL